MTTIIVDYGAGNLRSLVKAFERLQQPVSVTADRRDIQQAARILLPGVGHFGSAMDGLRRHDLIGPLTDRVMGDGIPILGVCLGMQLLFKDSEESGTEGLGWLAGRVRRLAPTGDATLKVPDMGWRPLNVRQTEPLFPDLGRAWRAYFAHSYHVADIAANAIAATIDYGGPVIAAVRAGPVMGVQFHPEKSHAFGRALLNAFACLPCAGKEDACP